MIRIIAIVAALVACKGKDSAPTPTTASGSETPAAKPDPIAKFDLPEIADGFEPASGDSIAVVVSASEIVVDGKSIIPLENGLARPEDREGGAAGMKLSRLSTMLAAYAEMERKGSHTFSPDKGFPLTLAVAKTVPYRTFMQVMYSAKQKEAGYRWFQILARSKGRFVQASIVLPDKSRPSMGEDDAVAFADLLTEGAPAGSGTDLGKQIEGVREKPGTDLKKQIDDAKKAPGSAAKPPPPANPAEQPLRLVVSVTKTETILWSMSGREGTLQMPKQRVAAGGDLGVLKKELDQIVAQHWAGKKEREQTILIMADGDIPMQRIAEVMAAVRPAFPDINFATGFE